MTLLAIDTSEQSCSVALLEGDADLCSVSEPIGRGHAERLLPLIEEQLQGHGHSYADLNRIAVTTGPGTFTGLRIGLSVARGLALQADLPCIGLTGLTVLAAQVMQEGGDHTVVHSLISGRGGQAFYQAFDGRNADGTPKALAEPVGLFVEEIIPKVRDASGILVGSGVDLLVEAGQQKELETEGLVFHPDRVISPLVLARLSAELDASAYPPEPTYFRAADAKKAVPILPNAGS